MTIDKILITGASGCVGQYVTSWLIKNSEAELFLWLRDPNKLTAVSPNHPRVRLLVGDLRDPSLFEKELSSVTRVIHTATAWGDPQRAYQVNIAAVKELLRLLNPSVIEQIIYFSTASILDKNLQPLSEARSVGTEYIQTKAQCLQDLEIHPLAEKIVAVFPTLVFGGKSDGKGVFPSSYLTAGLQDAFQWLWLVRWLSLDASFHFIHAADIAYICGRLATSPHLLNTEPGQGALRKIVLGQPAISMNRAIKTLCDWKGLKKFSVFPLSNWLIGVLVKILPIRINDWDRFSIKHRHFIHDPITTPERLGGNSLAPSLDAIIQSSGLPRRMKIRNRANMS